MTRRVRYVLVLIDFQAERMRDSKLGAGCGESHCFGLSGSQGRYSMRWQSPNSLIVDLRNVFR